jgi:hypothetical protein
VATASSFWAANHCVLTSASGSTFRVNEKSVIARRGGHGPLHRGVVQAGSELRLAREPRAPWRP